MYLQEKKIISRKKSSNRTGMSDSLLQRAESLSGVSMKDVRVHHNSSLPPQIGALAYTQDNQVYLGTGQESCLGHELGHVVQQKQGRVTATGSVGGQPLNDSPALEREADLFARRL